jgi:hypothetical protein
MLLKAFWSDQLIIKKLQPDQAYHSFFILFKIESKGIYYLHVRLNKSQDTFTD